MTSPEIDYSGITATTTAHLSTLGATQQPPRNVTTNNVGKFLCNNVSRSHQLQLLLLLRQLKLIKW